MDYRLKDRVVLITGATGGIGQALTRAFAGEGCKLALSSKIGRASCRERV